MGFPMSMARRRQDAVVAASQHTRQNHNEVLPHTWQLLNIGGSLYTRIHWREPQSFSHMRNARRTFCILIPLPSLMKTKALHSDGDVPRAAHLKQFY